MTVRSLTVLKCSMVRWTHINEGSLGVYINSITKSDVKILQRGLLFLFYQQGSGARSGASA